MPVQCKRKAFKSVAHARTAIYAMNARKAPQSNKPLYPRWCSNCKALHVVQESRREAEGA